MVSSTLLVAVCRVSSVSSDSALNCPLLLKNSEQILLGRCPIVVPLFFTATAYLSEDSHIPAPHQLLTPRFLYIHDSLLHSNEHHTRPFLQSMLTATKNNNWLVKNYSNTMCNMKIILHEYSKHEIIYIRIFPTLHCNYN